jgi:hypothetical protein
VVEGHRLLCSPHLLLLLPVGLLLLVVVVMGPGV